MTKILSQAGISLADVYDVEGSIAGVEQLLSREVSLVHELGATIFSERLNMQILRIPSGDIAQSVSWNDTVTMPASPPFRVLGVTVIVDTAGRTNRCNVSLRTPGQSREIPIWAWDSATADSDMNVQLSDDGGAIALTIMHVPVIYPFVVPSLGLGAQASQAMEEVVFRGAATGFGAGTVENIALVHVAFPTLGGVSSRGLPLPGW